MRKTVVRLALVGAAADNAAIGGLATPGKRLSPTIVMCKMPVMKGNGTSMPKDERFRVKRIQTNVVAVRERQLLTWLCTRLPAWMTPDTLTVIGICGAVLILVSDIASRVEPAFLWLASLGLIVHWFGDSLDGSVARYRQIERPVYGYFLDHTVDAICNLLIMAGLGFTLHVRMDVSLFTLIGYYLLCMYVFINNHLSGVFQLSFVGMGPTELRICLIGINVWMFFAGHAGLMVGSQFFSLYDLLLLFAAVMFIAIFLFKVGAGIRLLRHAPDGHAALQSASMKLSSPSK